MRRILAFSGLSLTLFAMLIGFELLDEDEPITAASLAGDIIETGLLALVVAAVVYIAIEARDFRRQRSDLMQDLAKARADGDRWRAAARVHIEGLGRAIQDQFNEWGLTDSESDVAILMLKGLSHKEIARLRESTEATVRQQAAAIYKKSDLSSRAELAAYFLEDLLPPEDRSEPARAGNHTLQFSK